MKHRILWTLIGVMAVAALVLAACAPPSNGDGNGNGVEEPQYGGSQTYRSTAGGVQGFDPMHWLNNGMDSAILDRWFTADWTKGPGGTGQYPYNVSWMPQNMLTGELLESWETVDVYQVNYKLREGIHFWDKAPVNGRELTTDDVMWNWLRHIFHPRSDGWMAAGTEADGLQWWTNYLEEIEDGLQPEQPLIDFLALMREQTPEVEEWFFGIEGYDSLEDYHRDTYGSSYDLLNDAGYDVSDGLILLGSVYVQVDDYNLEYHTARCGRSWGALQGIWPTPREVTEVDDFSNWETVVGTGPWIPTFHEPSVGVSFERNPDYWQNDPLHPENQMPYTDEYHVLMITDESAFYAALQTAQLDSGYAEYYKVPFFRENYPDMVETIPGNTSTFLLHLRNDVPPFDDVRVRWAASMAVDQEAIFNDRYKGDANFVSWPQQPWNTVVYQPLEAYDQVVQDCFSYDPEQAIDLLSEAGYPLGFETQIFVGSAAEGQEMAQIIQSYWADVGIDAEVNNMDETTLISHLWFKTYEHAIVSIWENDRPDDALNWCEGGVASTPYNFSMVDDPQNVLTSMEIACILDDDAYYARIKEDDIRRMNNMNHLILPTPQGSTFTWPWLGGHYGVTDMGPPDNSFGFELPKYRWIDQDLKASMGY
jgi:ABC-type transport system substrate-binding protein